MASGDRNKNGKATDIVCHYRRSIIPMEPIFCGQKVYWHSTTVKEDVTCKKCLKLMKGLLLINKPLTKSTH